jgi:putative transposase
MVGDEKRLSIERQCELLGVSRSTYYYKEAEATEQERAEEERAKGRLDYWHTKMPYMGVRKLVGKLKSEGIEIGRKLVKRYMGEMGIYAVYPKPNLSKRSQSHQKHPYLLRNKLIFLPNQVWAVDITYVAMAAGHMYLVAIIDWHSRFIVGWELSDTLEAAPVLAAVRKAIEAYGIPAIINSDQGTQFTSDEYTSYVKSMKIRQSMDSKARWIDNVIIERWFRSLKTENIYINEYLSPKALRAGIAAYISEYNFERPHQSLGYLTPIQLFLANFPA